MSFDNGDGTSPILNALFGLAALAVIIGVGFYVGQHVSCWDWFGLVKGCTVSK